MSFDSNPEELIVLEPLDIMPNGFTPPLQKHNHPPMVHDMKPHSHLETDHKHDDNKFYVDLDVDIFVEDLPGAGNDVPDLPDVEEVPEELITMKEEEEDHQKESKKSKKSDKWSWESRGADGFILWVKERIDGVPRHSGMDTAGLERAISYLERLDNEISKAMRLDLDGELDADKIEEIRSKMDEGLSRLYERLDKVKDSKKSSKKKRSYLESSGLVKEAQKITGVQGIYVTVPLLISRIARVCINGTISAGHDIEDLYSKQVKLYKLSNREQAEVMQLLSDMGYPVRQDRGFMPENALEVSDSDGMDYATNYKG